MQAVQSPMTIADYCAAMSRSEILSDDSYQRSNKVWPPAARSFLVESILLGFPLPKIFLFQKTDLKSKKTVKFIVDGQQRSKTIFDFFNNKLAVSKKSEVAEACGKRYDQLDDDLKGRFLSYQLSIDLFIAASEQEIRQAFRRLNSYTVPLNAEELRHAEYQGDFKWFIYGLTRDFEQRLLAMKVMGEKQMLRMQDEKLFAECAFSFIHGMKTTKAKELTSLYKNFDKDFPRQAEMQKRIEDGIDLVVSLTDIHGTALMKPYIFHTLVVAVSHFQAPLDTLIDIEEVQGPHGEFSPILAATNLTALADAIESEEPPERFASFVEACAEKTNTGEQRKSRVGWLYRALRPELI